MCARGHNREERAYSKQRQGARCLHAHNVWRSSPNRTRSPAKNLNFVSREFRRIAQSKRPKARAATLARQEAPLRIVHIRHLTRTSCAVASFKDREVGRGVVVATKDLLTWCRYPAVRTLASDGSCAVISSSVRFRGTSALRIITTASALEKTQGEGRGASASVYCLPVSWTSLSSFLQYLLHVAVYDLTLSCVFICF